MIRGLAARLGFWSLCAVSAVAPARADPPAFEQRLIDAGVTPTLVYDNVLAVNVAGGARRGTMLAGALHAQLALDGGKLVGVPGLSAFLDGLWLYGGNPRILSGDAQGVLNIGASPGPRVYEAWLQYNTPDNRVSVLAGRYDLNTEFYHLNAASLFFNSSFGIGPEFAGGGLAGPSIFPNTSLAARIEYKPTPSTVVRVAVLDGEPVDPAPGVHGPFDPRNGLLLVAEAAWVNRGPAHDPSHFHVGRQADSAAYDDKIAVGAWLYTARFADLSDPTRQRGESGAYLVADHLLYQDPNVAKRRLSGFLQIGVADPEADRFGAYLGAGLSVIGLLPVRPDDQAGVALAMARTGSHYLASQRQAGIPVSQAETALEVSYMAQVTPWLSLQPDIQYVIHPNTDPGTRNALMLQTRLEIRF